MNTSNNTSSPVIGRYADVLMDRWFKRSFGTNENKLLTEKLLQLLIPEHHIESITFVNEEHVNPFEKGKDVRVDVECTDQDGSRFVVEMQLAEQGGFYERAIFNSTFAVQQQIERGDRGYDFRPVYFIGVLNFSLHKDSDRVLYRYTLHEAVCGEQMSDRLQFIFMELPNCVNALTDRALLVDKVSYTLRNMSQLDRLPDNFNEEIILLLLKSAETSKFTPEERVKYINDMTTKQDIENQIQFAERQGLQRGMEKGVEKGMETKSFEIARKMLADDIPAGSVAKYTGLTEEQVLSL